MNPKTLEYVMSDEDRASDIADFLPKFYEIAARDDVTNVLELGVRGGCSTRAWLAGLHGHGHLWSVDIVPPPPDIVPPEHDDDWTMILGNDDDPEVWARLPENFDVALIDTDHDEMHTRRELKWCARHVRRGGYILLHDTENEHPEAHGEEIPPQESFPVKRALQWFAQQIKQPAYLDERGYGLGWITV